MSNLAARLPRSRRAAISQTISCCEEWASHLRRIEMATPLALTQSQVEQVIRTAGGVPRELRGQFLQFVADRLPAQPGDGEVFKACAAAHGAMAGATRGKVILLVGIPPCVSSPNRCS